MQININIKESSFPSTFFSVQKKHKSLHRLLLHRSGYSVRQTRSTFFFSQKKTRQLHTHTHTHTWSFNSTCRLIHPRISRTTNTWCTLRATSTTSKNNVSVCDVTACVTSQRACRHSVRDVTACVSSQRV